MKKQLLLFKKTIKIIIIINFIKYIFFKNINKNLNNDKQLLININDKMSINKYYLNEILNHNKIKFNITSFSYIFSYKFNITKIEYNIAFNDEDQHLIIPSDLTLYYKFHIFCFITETKKNETIKSLANIFKNKYYNCIEYTNLKEKFNGGIIIYQIKKNLTKYISIDCFNEQILNYNFYIYNNNNEFNPLILKVKYNKIINHKNKLKSNNSKSFIKLNNIFIDFPNYFIKSNIKNDSIWYFKNIYNHYFCLCKSFKNSGCLYENISQNCKYLFYLNIINNNKLLFNKTNYLLADFNSGIKAPGESYYIYKEMIKQNLNAHYMTKRKELLRKNTSNKLSIIYFEYINGNFLEKYLDLILRLKSVISGAKIYSMSNLFKEIEYITFICVGHGISYIKDFLYKNYYGSKTYDKILLPPSNLIISNAIKFGWNKNNIIKIGLPRWDLFYEYDNTVLKNNSLKKSIFVLFTWRKLKNKETISKYYFKNIVNFINNYNLHQLLKCNNITLNFAMHDNLVKYKIFLKINRFIKYIKPIDIINCLKKTSLVVSDFSSIIFDSIVRKKPYIIFIPDAEDSKIRQIYHKYYFHVINDMKNGKIILENKFFKVDEVIIKIKYYINNNFKLDSNLEKLYLKFNFQNKGNNIKTFIKYLKNLK